jgi:hypothetical protein
MRLMNEKIGGGWIGEILGKTSRSSPFEVPSPLQSCPYRKQHGRRRFPRRLRPSLRIPFHPRTQDCLSCDDREPQLVADEWEESIQLISGSNAL